MCAFYNCKPTDGLVQCSTDDRAGSVQSISHVINEIHVVNLNTYFSELLAWANTKSVTVNCGH